MAKKKTSLQLLTRYRVLQYSTLLGEFISIATPFVVMGIVNFDDWFATEEGWKIGLGGVLALALMGIATFAVTKRKEDKSITSGYVSLVVGWFATTFIFLLLSSIMEQITTIMFFGGMGLLGAFGLDVTSQKFKAKADLYKDIIQKTKQNLLKRSIEEEMEKDNNNVKF